MTAVPVKLVNPAEQSFIPRVFGGQAQVVLNTTSYDDVLSQLEEVSTALEAQQDGSDMSPISLMTSGCYINTTSETAAGGDGVRAGDGWRNCAAACSDPGTMFNSSYTFWNCLTLGAANIYNETEGMLIDPDELAAAGEKLGFDDLSQFNGTQILNDALQCIKGSCQDYSLGSCSKNISTLDISSDQDQVKALFKGVVDYCSGMDSIVDSDIAGPGVVLSYVLQAAFAVVAFVFLNLLSSWLRPLLSFLYTVQDRLSKPRPSRALESTVMGLPPRKVPWERAGKHQKNLSRSRPAAALTSALIEFQEVQGFFVISIQLATLIIFGSSDHSAMLSSTNSFAEAVMNVEIVQMLSTGGVLPVIFTQIGLMRLGVRWWYMTTINLVVFIMALVVSQQSLMPDYATLWDYFKEESPISACGGNPSPMTYCLDSLKDSNGMLERMNAGLTMTCVVVPFLLLDQAWFSLNHNGRLDEVLNGWEVASPKFSKFRRRVLPALLAVMWFCFEFGLLIFVGMYLKSVIDILAMVGMSASDWTFGQLIAIMVWMPVVGKYVYYNIFGITEGVGKRLASRFKVVEVDEDDEDDSAAPRPAISIEKQMAGDSSDGIEMKQRRTDTFKTLSREDTLVATMTPTTPRTPYVDSPDTEDFGRKNNPFDHQMGSRFRDV